ncbi:ABC transporter ATP-binding protein [Paenibacillus validus]|uniref:ATP-binding cassette domain-containing protein n=1 Tax=Paenibacillus validus TaxID=44253 RepID=A0A7X3CVT0_9BACL|nr:MULTISPECIES: ABC transporter ATP-binding protein [Paenibacillus]MED4602301.1 ABC transporter ATP-binding protein [Paenibacillus validus]MED4607972.1 ABC transporter ATP-binding protein [Paenibacillus validus]MUG74096.1 ATP-binding cassette domain-containing protein [Paenibacillus validus]
MLKVDQVHTYYGNSHILQGLSFEVPTGKCVALLGRNGAGKTTTIHSIAGLTPPRRGNITYMGKLISGLAPNKIARAGIGLVPQGRRIFPSLTIRENLIVPARDRKQTGTGDKSWRLEDIYDLFPILKERENNMGTQLSGGQQQMLAIGRALMTNPQFILMDEPSEGLAPVIIEQVGDIIRKLKQTGLSILLVEQNFYLACGVADTVLVMSKGQIVWQGTPEELLINEEIQHQYLGV